MLPLSHEEKRSAGIIEENIFHAIYNGGYPGVVVGQTPPKYFYEQYLATYVERDLREIRNVGNLTTFRRFLGILAGRVGNILDYASIANDVGLAPNTVKDWLSVLESSYIVHILPPYFNNFGKRLIKSPKIYFSDTGFVCWLLGIASASDLETHPLIGGLFENYIISEIRKHINNFHVDARMYFYRDSNKNEVDLILEKGNRLIPVEIKAGATYSKNMLRGIRHWQSLMEAESQSTRGRSKNFVIYTGSPVEMENARIESYRELSALFAELAG